MPDRTFHVVTMGVAGTGKTTVAVRLAERLGLRFIEGDDHHPPENIAKMTLGQPLDDDDRKPWLEDLAAMVAEAEADGVSTIVTCSALRRTYRDILRSGATPGRLFFLHLHGELTVLADRMRDREKHFMPASLLQSQLDTLEPLAHREEGAVVNIDADVDTVVEQSERAVRAWVAEQAPR